MADGPITQLADLIVPEIFNPYTQVLTTQKSAFVNAGIVERSGVLDAKMNGGGQTFHFPSFSDLDNDEDRISTDSVPAGFTGGVKDPDPRKIKTLEELAVRLDRNQSWAAARLAQDLIGADPMNAIMNRVSSYWARRLNQLIISVVTGIFADNAAAASGTDKHVQGDMTLDIKGNAFAAGTTNISGGAVLEALTSMEEDASELSIMVVHNRVMTNLRKQNLIAVIPPSEGRVAFETYLGRRIIETNLIPTPDNKIFETWFFAPGALKLGVSTPPKAVQLHDLPGAGNGAGADVLYNRVAWCLHPVGYRYAGAVSTGGPANTTLAAAASWSRIYPERKQVRIARLITRES